MSMFECTPDLLVMTPEELRSLRLPIATELLRPLNQKEIEAIFQACGAFWFHSGNPKAPHAELTSGKCSNGYIDCNKVLTHSNLCQIMAEALVSVLQVHYQGRVDWVVGSDSAALGLSKDVANKLGACWHPLQKGPDKTQVWEKVIMPQGAIVLHVEELMTTAITANAVRQAIKTGNPNPVNFVPFLPVLIHRPAPGEGDVVDGSQVIYAAHYDIWAADPADCPLCKQGSERLRPKGANWDRLVRGA